MYPEPLQQEEREEIRVYPEPLQEEEREEIRVYPEPKPHTDAVVKENLELKEELRRTEVRCTLCARHRHRSRALPLTPTGRQVRVAPSDQGAPRRNQGARRAAEAS